MHDPFDDSFDDDSKSSGASDFARLFEESMGGVGRKLAVGDKVRGEVLSVGKEEIFVSTGTINDGVVLRNDLDGRDVKTGDFLDLYVTRVQGSQIQLSTKPTSKNLSDDLEDAFDMMLPVEGRVIEVCNGGFRVNVLGKTAFCPLSQMDSRRVDDAQSYVGKKLEFMITQFDPRGRNIVVSRRKLLDEQKEASTAAFTEAHKPGEVLKGVITRLEPFGAFIEVEAGLEGLCHISEIAWSRLAHPSEAVKPGQAVSAKIIKIEEGLNGRLNISLSIKQAEAPPWENLPASIREGEVIEGRVTRCMKFGAFVEIAPGIEGLVPLSEMSDTKRVTRSDEIVKEGDRVSVLIKEVRASEQRLVLSIKDADPDAVEYAKITAAQLAKPQQAAALGTLGDQFKGLFGSASLAATSDVKNSGKSQATASPKAPPRKK